ncbi:MAG: transposase [Nitrososphaeria archaeon]
MPHESIVEHVRRLLSETFELGIKVKLLLLDAGYYSVKVINLLNSSGIKFIMRMPDIGKFKDGDDLMYTTDSHKYLANEQATFRVAAFNGRNRAGRTELFVFATNTDLKTEKIRKVLKKRWAIEASYRMINQFLPKTT